MDINNSPVVVITGAHTEICLQTIKEFVTTGANVIIWCSDNKGIQQQHLNNLNTEYLPIDISNALAIEEATQYTIKKYNRIDILINNAQLESTLQPSDLDNGQWQKVIDINLSAMFNTIKYIAPYMIKQKFGRIINATSLAYISEYLPPVHYEAAKSGIKSITRVWARELSKNGITVNAVYIGYIQSRPFREIEESELENIKSKIPARRLGEVAEVSKTFKFLASADASYITGIELNIDGGYFC